MSLKLLTALAVPLLSSSALAKTPTSDIPDRREFPVNSQVNACENFYEHVCTEAIKGFKLRDDRSSHVFSFSDSRERILDRKKKFLSELTRNQAHSKLSPRSQTLATVYGACMNADARKAEELALVKATFARVDAIKSHEDFWKFLKEQRDSGQYTFVDIGSIANQDNPDFNDFYFFTDLASLPERSYYLDATVSKDFEALVTDFFAALGDAKASDKAKLVVDFERAYAKVHPLPAEMREIFSKKSQITKADILAKYPSFLLEKTLARVPDKTPIRHFIPDTFAFVEKALAKEDLSTLKSVYLYQALASIMDDAYPDFFNKRFAFNQKHLGAAKVRPVREERCTQMVMNTFDKELDAEVLPLMFPNFPEEKFIALAEKVRSSIIQGVQNNDWLSADGKKGAIEKMQKAKLQLVKPRNDDEWRFNPIAAYDATRPIDNIVRLNLALTERMFRELSLPRNRDRWSMGPLTVNAYYSASDNKFVMPIGILQYPFYDPNLPEQINLGAVGAVIGHELGHGIDDQGAKYDATGALRQWMTDKDVKAFQERGRKFVDQFNKIGHDGELTLGENIGDLTGVTFAYNAAFPGGQGKLEDKKNFFLQYGRLWCGVELPKFTEQMLKVDSHSRGWARVNQQVKNQPEFAKVFGCQSKDAMVLPTAEVVKIW